MKGEKHDTRFLATDVREPHFNLLVLTSSYTYKDERPIVTRSGNSNAPEKAGVAVVQKRRKGGRKNEEKEC